MSKLGQVRARTPADVLAVVPLTFGFRPEDSLVLLTVGGVRDSVHARVDLPRDDAGLAEVTAVLTRAVRRNRVRRVMLVAYSADSRRCQQVVSRLEAALRADGVRVEGALRADGARWHRLTGCDPTRCTGPCCSGEGVPYDLDVHPVTTRAVFAGRVTLASRADLEKSLVGTPAEGTRVAEAAARAGERNRSVARHPLGPPAPESSRRHRVAEGRWVRGRVSRFLSDGARLPDDDAGRLLAALVDVDVRDVAWAGMSTANASRHVDLWRDLVRRAPEHLLAAPAALLGFAAWLSGEGALAWCAVDRCLRVDPGYRVATLLAGALTEALPPRAWRPIGEEELALFRG